MTSTSTQFTAARKLNVVKTLAGHKPYIVDGPDGERSDPGWSPVVSYFPDGQKMVSGYGETARIWDLKAGKEMEEACIVCEQSVEEVAVSRDSRWVIAACSGGELKVCEVKTGVIRTFKGNSSSTMTIDISRDSKLLVSGSEDGTTRIWDLETGNLMASTSSPPILWAVLFSQDSKKLAVMTGNGFEVWNVNIEARKLEIKIRKNYRIGVNVGIPVFWTTDDRTFVTAFYLDPGPGPHDFDSIYEIDSSTLDIVGAPFQEQTNEIDSLHLSFDCTLLVSASNNDTVKLWAFESRHLLASFNVHGIHRVALSPDTRQLAYTTWNADQRRIKICDIPPDILAKLWPGQEAPGSNVRGNGDPLNSDATAPRSAAAQRYLVPAPVAAQPLGHSPTTIHQQDFFVLRYFRKLLSHKDQIPAIAIEPCDPLDCPATSPRLSSKLSSAPTTNLMHRNSVENPGHMLPPISQFPNRSSSSTSRIRHIFSWRPARIDHALPPIIDVSHAEGRTRNAADGARAADDGCVLETVDSRPTSPDSIPQHAPAGEHGGGRLCGCF